jgi:uncharacterized membrane protein YccF (DUF307 family)
VRNPNGALQLTLDGCKLALWVPWALTWGTVGLVLIALIITAPLGLVCWGIAAWPLTHMVDTRNKRQVEWNEHRIETIKRESTTAKGLPPWLMDDDEEEF